MFALQFFLLPRVNTALSEETYGLLITIISLVTLITDAAGNSLNNVRLISDVEYSEKGYHGDFNFLFLMLGTLATLFAAILSIVYMNGASFADILGIIVMTLFFMGVRYFIVGFLIRLNYMKLMIGNLLQTAGFFVGYLLFRLTLYWQWIYIVGYSANLIYILLSTKLIREGWGRTPLFEITIKKEMIILASCLLAGSITYFDKLMLYPLMGGVYVSIYYAATLFGKLLTTVMNPISNLILSYFSRAKAVKQKTIKSMLLTSCITGILSYVICLLLSRPILGYLYPAIAEDAMQYVYVTILTGVIDMQYFVLRPIILRFSNVKWQIVVHGANIAVYVGLSMLLFYLWGMMGFCIGVCIASAIRFVMVRSIYLISKKNYANIEEAL